MRKQTEKTEANEMLDKKTMDSIQRDLTDALQRVGKKHNVQLRFAGGRFSSCNGTMKLSIATIDKDGTVKSQEEGDWLNLAPVFGLNVKWLGKKVIVNGEAFVIVGLKPRSSKFPVVAARLKDDKRFKLTVSSVKEGMLYTKSR